MTSSATTATDRMLLFSDTSKLPPSGPCIYLDTNEKKTSKGKLTEGRDHQQINHHLTTSCCDETTSQTQQTEDWLASASCGAKKNSPIMISTAREGTTTIFGPCILMARASPAAGSPSTKTAYSSTWRAAKTREINVSQNAS